MADRKLTVRVEAETARLSAGMKRASASVNTFGGSIQKGITRHAAGIRMTGMALAGLGAAVTGMAVVSIKAAVGFERELANVSTMLDDISMKFMPEYEASLRNMAKEFGQSTKTLSKGLYDILSASIPPAKALDVLGVAAKSAVAGLSETGITADAITTILNSYGFAAENAGEVSDKLWAIIKKGKTTMIELAPSIGKVAAVAATAGLSFDELGATLATITRGGVKTDVAMTNVKAIMLAFLKPTDDAAKAAKEFGLELSSNTLRSEGLRGVIKLLTNATAEQLATILPNVRGLTGMAIALKDTTGWAESYEAMLNSAGLTEEMFQKQTGALAFTFDQLKQELADVFRVLGKELIPIIKADLVPLIREAIEHIKVWIERFKGLSTGTKKFLLILGPLLIALGGFLVILPSLVTAIGAVKVAYIGLKVAVLALSGPIGWIILAIVAVTAAFIYFYKTNEGFRNVINNIGKAFYTLGVNIKAWTIWFKNNFVAIWKTIFLAIPIIADNALNNLLVIMRDFFLRGGWKDALSFVYESLLKAFGSAFTAVGNAFSIFKDNIMKWLGHIAEKMKPQNWLKKIKAPDWAPLFEGFKVKFGEMTSLADREMRSLTEGIEIYWEPMPGWITPAFDAVKKGASEAGKAVKKFSKSSSKWYRYWTVEVEKASRKLWSEVSKDLKNLGKRWVEVTKEVTTLGKRWVEITKEVTTLGKRWIEVTKEVKTLGKTWIEVTKEVTTLGKRWVEITKEVTTLGKRWVEITKEVTTLGKRWVEITEKVTTLGKRWVEVTKEVTTLGKRWMEVTKEVTTLGKRWIEVTKEVGKPKVWTDAAKNISYYGKGYAEVLLSITTAHINYYRKVTGYMGDFSEMTANELRRVKKLWEDNVGIYTAIWDTFAGDVKTAMKNLFKDLITGLEGGKEAWKDLWTSFGDIIVDAFRDAFARSLVEKMGLDKMFEGNILNLGNLFEGLGNLVVGVFKGIGNIVGSVFGVGTAAPAIATTGQSITMAGNAAATSATQIAEAGAATQATTGQMGIMTKVGLGLEKVVLGFGKAFSYFANLGANATTVLGALGSGLAGVAGMVGTAIAGWLAFEAVAKNVIGPVFKALGEGLNDLFGLTGSVNDSVEGMTRSMEDLGRGMAGIGEGVMASAQNVESFKDQFIKIVRDVALGVRQIGDMTHEESIKWLAEATATNEYFTEEFKNTVLGILAAAAEGAEAIVEKSREAVARAYDATLELHEKTAQVLTNLQNASAQVIVESVIAVEDAIEHTTGETKKAFEEQLETLKRARQYGTDYYWHLYREAKASYEETKIVYEEFYAEAERLAKEGTEAQIEILLEQIAAHDELTELQKQNLYDLLGVTQETYSEAAATAEEASHEIAGTTEEATEDMAQSYVDLTQEMADEMHRMKEEGRTTAEDIKNFIALSANEMARIFGESTQSMINSLAKIPTKIDFDVKGHLDMPIIPDVRDRSFTIFGTYSGPSYQHGGMSEAEQGELILSKPITNWIRRAMGTPGPMAYTPATNPIARSPEGGNPEKTIIVEQKIEIQSLFPPDDPVLWDRIVREGLEAALARQQGRKTE